MDPGTTKSSQLPVDLMCVCPPAKDIYIVFIYFFVGVIVRILVPLLYHVPPMVAFAQLVLTNVENGCAPATSTWPGTSKLETTASGFSQVCSITVYLHFPEHNSSFFVEVDNKVYVVSIVCWQTSLSEKGTNICDKRSCNDGMRQINHLTPSWKFKGELI